MIAPFNSAKASLGEQIRARLKHIPSAKRVARANHLWNSYWSTPKPAPN